MTADLGALDAWRRGCGGPGRGVCSCSISGSVKSFRLFASCYVVGGFSKVGEEVSTIFLLHLRFVLCGAVMRLPSAPFGSVSTPLVNGQGRELRVMIRLRGSGAGSSVPEASIASASIASASDDDMSQALAQLPEAQRARLYRLLHASATRLNDGSTNENAAPAQTLREPDSTAEQAPAAEQTEAAPAAETTVTADVTGRYTKPDAIWAALETGAVKLAKMTWLIEMADKDGVLPRRQDCPAEAFVSVAELRAQYGEGNEDGVLPIVTISFCWDAPNHPDGRGKQLKTVAAALQRQRGKFAALPCKGKSEGFTEMGVFWE